MTRPPTISHTVEIAVDGNSEVFSSGCDVGVTHGEGDGAGVLMRADTAVALTVGVAATAVGSGVNVAGGGAGVLAIGKRMSSSSPGCNNSLSLMSFRVSNSFKVKPKRPAMASKESPERTM